MRRRRAVSLLIIGGRGRMRRGKFRFKKRKQLMKEKFRLRERKLKRGKCR